MKSWNRVRDKVRDTFQGEDPKSTSTLKNLLPIIDKAEVWGINPSDAYEASPSNLREIIREAKKAIDKGNKSRLEELFRLAANYTNRDLRLAVRDDDREVIIAEKIPGEYTDTYKMEVTPEQLDRFRNALKLQYRFEVKEK